MKQMRKPQAVVVDLTPLIDCVFLLIAFFVVAGRFKKEETRLDAFLPKSDGMNIEAEMSPDKFFIQINCLGARDEITWQVNNMVVETRSRLVAKLNEIQALSYSNGKDTKVIIEAGPDVNFYWIIASLDACAEAQLTEIIFTPPRIPLDQWPSSKFTAHR